MFQNQSSEIKQMSDSTMYKNPINYFTDMEKKNTEIINICIIKRTSEKESPMEKR